MKISVRLTLYSIIITTLAILLCCGILLATTADNHISSAIDTAATELGMLENAFRGEMEAASDRTLSGTAQRSLVLFIFRKYTSTSASGAHYALADSESILYNDSPIDPRPLLPNPEISDGMSNSDAPPSAIAELNGRRYLVIGQFSLLNRYEVYIIRDITAVYDGIISLGFRFALIAFIAIVISILMMIFLIRRTLSPLNALQKNAAALANGQYDKRIAVQGNDEIAELSGRFNKMADSISRHIETLEDTAQQRKLLLSALTHELKTPMTAIIGYSESLMRVKLSPQQKEESIAYIHRECKRIERLSQKMMRLVALHGGEAPNISPQAVSTLFSAAESTLYKIAEQENIALRLDCDDDFVLDMDTDMMASVLINLFDNARKAGAKRIVIAAKSRCLSLTDDGAGIPADEIKRIVQPFYMVDKSHSQSNGGSGVGLALCDLICKAHQAQFSIESELGKGTTAIISFEHQPKITS